MTTLISSPGPNQRIAFTDANGMLTRVGYELLLSFLTRTGGQGGVSSSDLSGVLAQLQQLVGEQGAEIHDLEVAGAAGTDVGAVFQKQDERGEAGDASYLVAITDRLKEIELQLEQYRGADALLSKIAELETQISEGLALGYDPLTSLGTMSTQNSGAVSITGGAIDGVAIGTTTQSSGTFTILKTLGATAAPVVTEFSATTSVSAPIQVQSDALISGTATVSATYFRTQVGTVAATFTVPTVYHFAATQGTIGTGSAITNQYGFYAGGSLTGAANNMGFLGNVPVGGSNWNFYTLSAAKNYFSGTTLIGSATDDGSGNKLQVNTGISIAPATTTTAPAAGGAGALPATPTGYANITIGGTVRKMAYY